MKKRGISSIIGTLLMVAVVAIIGTVILFQGLNGINDFNYYLSFLTGTKDSLYENAMIEHVRFNPATNDLDVWVKNTGTVQIEVKKVSMMKIDTQEIITLDDSTPNDIVSISELVNIPQHATITGGVWDDCAGANYYCAAQYRISITTATGNSFETVATPFNT
jgi:FlaG/FlaF family flagellin (archaellin)